MEPFKIKELITTRRDQLIIPAIQRKYVWKEKKICDFFESIMRGYPIGQILLWKIKGKEINNNSTITFYDFLKDYDEKSDDYNTDIRGIVDEREYYAILDGQQRIQSLIIGLDGHYTNSKNKIEKELYINLSERKEDEDEMVIFNGEYDYDSEEDDEDEDNEDEYNYKYELKFLTDDEVKNDNNIWYRVKDIKGKEDAGSIRKELSKYSKKFKSDKEEDYAKDILDRLSDVINSQPIIQVENIDYDKFKIDEILEIFIRTNSGGEKLSKSDLLFSTVVSRWNNGRDTIDKFLKDVNKKNEKLSFKFTNDFIMRTFLYILSDEKEELTMKIEKFGIIADKVEENWDNISNAIEKTARKLRTKGISSNSIKSHNAIIPIVYYFYNGGSSTKEDLDEIEKYIVVSQMSQIFGVDSNRALKNTRKALKGKKNFKLEYFKDAEFAGGKKLIPTVEDFKSWMNCKKGTQYATLILRFLYPDMDKKRYNYDQDHVHPKKEIEAQHNKEFENLKNNIPNLQLLADFENEEDKKDKSLEEWCENHPRPKYLSKKTSLKIEDFLDFYEDRSNQIIKQLKKSFKVK